VLKTIRRHGKEHHVCPTQLKARRPYPWSAYSSIQQTLIEGKTMEERCRLLWLNPIGSDAFDAAFRDMLNSFRREGTEVTVRSLARGPHHLEYHLYESLVLADLLAEVRRAEKEDFDAIVLGCFYDVGLREAREISSRLVVVAPAEACTHLACQLGDRFSVIVGRRKWIPQMRRAIESYGLGSRLASFRVIHMGVGDLQVDPQETSRRIEEQARKAVEEDGAEVIVLGCTIEFGFFRQLQQRLGVPVLDAVSVPMKFAEFLVELRQRFGWTHSKVCAYESPPAEEISRWKLFEQYDFSRPLGPKKNR
jgi:allantoin racemase